MYIQLYNLLYRYNNRETLIICTCHNVDKGITHGLDTAGNKNTGGTDNAIQYNVTSQITYKFGFFSICLRMIFKDT